MMPKIKHNQLIQQKQENQKKFLNSKMSNQPILPLGFADQVLELQIKLQEEESLQLIQILSQMYKIAVDYYIQMDIRKADYFQKKLNHLVVRSLDITNPDKHHKPYIKTQLPKKLKNQIEHYEKCGASYVKQIVAFNEKKQNKIRGCIDEDISRQQKKLMERILMRARSVGKF